MSQTLTDAQLQQQLADKLMDVEKLEAQIAQRTQIAKRTRAQKRARPVDVEANDDEEKSAEPLEPLAKKQKTEELAVQAEEDNASDYEDGDSEMEEAEVLADGTFVAVAYGNLNGLSKRRWYAAKVANFNEETGVYTVVWKFPPKKTIAGKKVKKNTFECSGDRLRVIAENDYENAPQNGTGYVGLHRASTFVVHLEDAEEESEDEGVQVGDHVAVAYGNARANAKGADPTKGRNPKKFHKRFLWYAATVTAVNEDKDDVTVAWAVPFSKKDAKLPIDERSPNAYFQTTQDKVQPITAKEFKKSKKSQKSKKTYGLVGIHRVTTKANLTSGN